MTLHVDSARIAENALSPQQLPRATFTSHAQAFGCGPKALSGAPILLTNCVLGPNGPRIKAKAFQEIVVGILRGEGCT
jgi:hypothetical protein